MNIARRVIEAPIKGVKALTDRVITVISGRRMIPKRYMKLLEVNYDKKIQSITINRTPIKVLGALETFLELVSLGRWSQIKKDFAYDSLFHLYILVVLEDGKSLLIEKNHVIKVAYSDDKGKDQMNVPINKEITLRELMVNTQKRMGLERFLKYNAFSNNCQVFVKSILEANGLLTSEMDKFIMQDVENLASEFLDSNKWKDIANKGMEKITDLARKGDELLYGSGKIGGSRKRYINDEKYVVKFD